MRSPSLGPAEELDIGAKCPDHALILFIHVQFDDRSRRLYVLLQFVLPVMLARRRQTRVLSA